MSLSNRKGEGVLVFRNRDNMNVIRHEAPSKNAERVSLGLKVQEFEIESSIVIGKEDVLPVIAALSDVVCSAGQDESRPARHTG